MSEETNSKLSSLANAFPGNTKSVPDFVDSDELFKTAFEIYKGGYPANEFVGLPVAEQLMRSFDEQLQRTLSGQQDVDEMLAECPRRLDERVLAPVLQPVKDATNRADPRHAADWEASHESDRD